jgi:hypothetical protein
VFGRRLENTTRCRCFCGRSDPPVMLLSFLLSSEPPWRMQFPETRLPRATSVCMKAKKCGKYRLTQREVSLPVLNAFPTALPDSGGQYATAGFLLPRACDFEYPSAIPRTQGSLWGNVYSMAMAKLKRSPLYSRSPLLRVRAQDLLRLFFLCCRSACSLVKPPFQQ